MTDRNATQTALSCYRCGSPLASLSLPLARLDLCPECGIDLHVCRMCKRYAPSAPDGCNEEDAPEVRNKATANFCDYFDPAPNAFDGRERQADDRARATLEKLFGGGNEASKAEREAKSGADPLLDQAEDLFKR
jgi:hypothetical protein